MAERYCVKYKEVHVHGNLKRNVLMAWPPWDCLHSNMADIDPTCIDCCPNVLDVSQKNGCNSSFRMMEDIRCTFTRKDPPELEAFFRELKDTTCVNVVNLGMDVGIVDAAIKAGWPTSNIALRLEFSSPKNSSEGRYWKEYKNGMPLADAMLYTIAEFFDNMRLLNPTIDLKPFAALYFDEPFHSEKHPDPDSGDEMQAAWLWDLKAKLEVLKAEGYDLFTRDDGRYQTMLWGSEYNTITYHTTNVASMLFDTIFYDGYRYSGFDPAHQWDQRRDWQQVSRETSIHGSEPGGWINVDNIGKDSDLDWDNDEIGDLVQEGKRLGFMNLGVLGRCIDCDHYLQRVRVLCALASGVGYVFDKDTVHLDYYQQTPYYCTKPNCACKEDEWLPYLALSPAPPGAPTSDDTSGVGKITRTDFLTGVTHIP